MNLSDDLIDPAELRLARRVGTYANQAVVPIDPVAIAAAASVAVRRRTIAGRLLGGRGGARATARLGLLGAAAVVTAVALGSVISGGWHAALPTQTAVGSGVAVDDLCASTDLRGRIVVWDGAAGSRIATVELTNATTEDCSLRPYELSLVDAGGRGQALILSRQVQPSVRLAAGATVHTLIDASNYCLAYVPVEPVSIRLDDPLGQGDVVLAAAIDGLSGVPPCNGAPGSPGSISQQPWTPGPAPAR
jgi:Domain of unknown function (DUF4232)